MLDKNQQEAANYLNGPLRIIACPGSGKTTTILERAHNLILSGIPAVNVVMITFSKQAAEHMRAKYRSVYGAPIPTVSTIHSMCFSILRNEGLLNDSPVISDAEKYSLISDFMVEDMRINSLDVQEKVADFFLEAGSVKLRDKDINKYNAQSMDACDFKRAFLYYEEEKNKLGKMDFEDMLIKTRALLKNDKGVLSEWQSNCKYITVDEFQDTDRIQSEIIYMLASDNHNICVVGDIDQSIYRFRGADPEIMLEFNKAFPDCKDVKLSTNYRSKRNIVNSAAAMIINNKKRFDIPINAKSSEDGKIKSLGFPSSKQQWLGITKTIKRLNEKFNTPYDEIAVLCRTNSQNRLLVGALMKAEIPFFTTEKLKDYHSDIVYHDILAYYRMSHGFPAKGDIRIIMRRPETYISGDYFSEVSVLNRASADMILDKIPSNKSFQNKKRLLDQRLYHLRKMSQINDPATFIDYMSTYLDYKRGLQKYAEIYGRDGEMLVDIFTTLSDEASGFNSMDDWQHYVDNYTRELSKQNKEKEGVCLSTYHSSKGLEWDTVFLPDANDGFAPYKKAVSPDDFEEERRLFYVAATRAKSRLFMSKVEKSGSNLLVSSPYLAEMGYSPEVRPENTIPKSQQKNLFAVAKDRK